MKRKLMFIGTITSASVIALSLFFSSRNLNLSAANADNIVNQTITFTSTDRNPVTPHGNIIDFQTSGTMAVRSGCVCAVYQPSSNTGGSFYTATPFQSISKVELNWSTNGAYQGYLKVGTEKGGSNIYSSDNFVPMFKSVDGQTQTVNIANPSEAHYVTATFNPINTGSIIYINWIRITYSCSYTN